MTFSVQLISVSILGAFAQLLQLYCFVVVVVACAALFCLFTVPFLCICIVFCVVFVL